MSAGQLIPHVPSNHFVQMFLVKVSLLANGIFLKTINAPHVGNLI